MGLCFKSVAVRFGICVLLIYAGLVVLYASYIIFFWVCGPGWSSGAWGEIGELLALALVSRPPATMINTGGGIDESTTWRQIVKIREASGETIEMIVGDQESNTEHLRKGRMYG